MNIALQSVLKGISQIMLQSNVFTGLLFLGGIACGSVPIALGTLFGAVIGTLTAYALHYDRHKTEDGLYGFSAALVGAAAFVFLQPTLLTWGIAAVGAALAAILQHFFILRRIPAFTLPFIIVTWLFLWAVHHFQPQLLSVTPPSVEEPEFLFPLESLGEVIFENSWIAGLLFLIGLLVSSPLATAYGVGGAFLGGLIAKLLGVPDTAIAQGLWGYNAALCAIALSGRSAGDIGWTVGATLLALLVQLPFGKLGVPALTFPFVAATFLCVMLKTRATNTILK